jgi:asparagine synthase (glutamine-hydrolysing)
MCGIFASLSKDSLEKLAPYFNLIQYRGPDSSQYVQVDTINGQNLLFGFHRLAIVDPEEKSMQPLVHNGLWLICNGEIFNHKELEIKFGLNMHTGSDCEIILHLYEKFGRNEDALKRLLNELNAEFAFVLYDSQNKTLMAARDPFGVRPLFYSYSGEEICMASELKALAFREFVKPFIPGSYIFREQCGSYNTTKFIKYHKLLDFPLFDTQSAHLIQARIATTLDSAVNRRLMSDRPLGCFLSGGVDSSLITALVAKRNPNLECFTIGLKGGVDIEAAKIVVAHLNHQGANIKHHIIHFTVEEGIKAIKDVIWHLETYDITTVRASVPQYILSKYISENTTIKVLLSGEGSDEVNASYLYNRFAPSAEDLARDSARLVDELYMFDNLRVDRTTAAFGLEVRVPFLDTYYVAYMFSLDPELRMCKDVIEKKLLRDAFACDLFSDGNLLPSEILYRRKEAFSDAVSSDEQSWYKSVVAHADAHITDEEFQNSKYRKNQPPTKEALYYRKIFDGLFPNRENVLNHYWMPSWVDTKGDPSATAIPGVAL